MKKQSVIVFLLSGSVLFVMGRAALSMEEYKTEDEEAKAYNVTRSVKTVQGLNFRVEDDRPIEKIAGVYRPIDLDSYIALKFGKLEKKMNDQAAATQQQIDGLNMRLEALTQKVNALSSPAPAPAGNQTAPTSP
jgi:uncharacterized coiled-coil protein SlyX